MYPQPVHMLAQVRGGPEVVELNEYLEGKVGQRVHYPSVLRPETLPKRLQTRRLQAITGQVPVRETIMRWYRHTGMDLPEEYMRCHCGRGQQTYEHFMRCEQYKGIEEPLVRDQDVPLLKKGARYRSAVERELGKEGHRKGLWHIVIVKPLWQALQEHIGRRRPWHTGCCGVWWNISRSAWRAERRSWRRGRKTCVIQSPNGWRWR